MKPTHRRERAHHIVDAYRCRKRRTVQLIELSRSYFYYQPRPRDDRAERARSRQNAETGVRFGYDLDVEGFHGDEEITVFGALPMAQGKEAQMQSSMPYRRSPPFTWLFTRAVQGLGLNEEHAYRTPRANFGILSVRLLFFLAKLYLGTLGAVIAALSLRRPSGTF